MLSVPDTLRFFFQIGRAVAIKLGLEAVLGTAEKRKFDLLKPLIFLVNVCYWIHVELMFLVWRTDARESVLGCLLYLGVLHALEAERRSRPEKKNLRQHSWHLMQLQSFNITTLGASSPHS